MIFEPNMSISSCTTSALIYSVKKTTLEFAFLHTLLKPFHYLNHGFLGRKYQSARHKHSGNISYKRVDKNIFGTFFDFFGQNNVLEGPEGLHINLF